ncbi:MAG: hypothetical protein HYY20_02055 [Candidatus Tectomicrobia bacterium]|uniref:FlgD Ig-like domain-containing protein n=1 Tax=Tectimicrobiota bacterium TaxID=2528274 RepID=A0A932CMJ9_UNCTE|nr:hypothetical protein [Candidatus Tectomicrobia bacterium]
MKIAILPFENLTDVPEAPDRVLPYLVKVFLEEGYRLVPYEETYSYLLRNRLREIGSVSRATARRIAREFGADAILVGMVNLYRERAGDPQLGLSLRMIRAEDGVVFWTQEFSGSGRDFAGLLDLGRLSSVEALLMAAVQDMRAALPQSASPSWELPPVELEQVVLPKSLPGGKLAEATIKVVSIEDEPSKIEIAVGDGPRQVMKEAGKGLYRALLAAPHEEGHYPVKIFYQVKGRTWSLNPGEELVVDNMPPQVEITVRDEVISPNEDGWLDSTVFLLKDLDVEAIGRWNLSITNARQETILRYGKEGPLPRGIRWSGRDPDGYPFPDGTYVYRLRVEDRAGNATETAPASIAVDTQPPAVEVAGWFHELAEGTGASAVVDASEDLLVVRLTPSQKPMGLLSKPGMRDLGVRRVGRMGPQEMERPQPQEMERLRCTAAVQDASPIRSWSFSLYDDQGEEVAVYEGEGKPPKGIVLERGVGGPQLHYALEIMDRAGNRTLSKGVVRSGGAEPGKEKENEEGQGPVEFN